MIKEVVAFGDSWTYGDELVDPALRHIKNANLKEINFDYKMAHAFPALVANNYGASSVNHGVPGASLQSTLWNVIQWINDRQFDSLEGTLVLVGLTAENRFSVYDETYRPQKFVPDHPISKYHNYVEAIWLPPEDAIEEHYNKDIDETRPFYDMFGTFHRHCLCEGYEDLMYQTTVRTLDALAVRYGFHLVQFNVIATRFIPGISTLLPVPQNSLLQWFQMEHPHELGPFNHPIEAGHERIANFLIHHIDSAILA